MRGIWQADSLSSLFFVSAMIPLTYILRQSKPGYTFLCVVGRKINHLLLFGSQYMDNLKLYNKNEKELDSLIQTLRVFIQHIRMEFGVEYNV